MFHLHSMMNTLSGNAMNLRRFGLTLSYIF